ncbi:ABC transporter permease [Effusibacillus lacus]|uniref:Peptide ABC transporter permease n=1 Tax=Effusibacillus lacus TaxID=1348429 RepID=A0A292YKQ9_9BACL|nr:ABC transporter permease [Effusibacillus lacus]TCS73617.1 oligopeptide transport system permease protein [Effusibacillus lacus]GAX89491.1 peptide ABC transporter permease [Effusibacillus lacus]
MVRYTLRRFVYMLITLWLIVTTTFILMKNLPGDPFENSEKLTKEQKAILMAQYGLDKPVWEQYVNYLKDVAQGDLGVSFQYPARKVTEVIAQGFPASLELGIWALSLAITAGLALGIIAALKHNTKWDYTAMFTAVVGISVPSFVLGPLLSYFIGVKLGWLPPGLWQGPEHRILPAIALSFSTLAILARLMRTSMLDVINQDYIKTAKSKGLSQFAIVTKHTLRNAILPVVTILGPIFVNVITGTLVVEQIFSVPGLGRHFVMSVYSNDYTMISGLTIFYSVILVFVMFLTDIAYGLIDPRIRLAKGRG